MTSADDGPNPDHTETLLEGLKERNVKATFFLLGAECEKYPEIVKKIHADGHLIGVHSHGSGGDGAGGQNRPDYFWTDRRTCAVYQTALRLLEMQS